MSSGRVFVFFMTSSSHQLASALRGAMPIASLLQSCRLVVCGCSLLLGPLARTGAHYFGSSPGTARIRVSSSTVLHVSAFDGSVHHLPLPYVDSRRAMIFASSSDSFGSDGGASTLPTFSRFSIRRSSAGTPTLSYFV